MALRIDRIRWGVFTQPTDIQAPLFKIPARCTIHVELDAGGLLGYGYAFCFDADIAMVLQQLGLAMSRPVLGTSPDEWDDVRTKLDARFVNFLGTQGMAVFITSALDIAIWDLHCKALGQSLQCLRKRPDKPAACYISAELWPSVAPARCAEIARGFIERGFRGLKLWVSSPDPKHEAARVAAVRSAVGPDIALMIDANQVYRPDQAVRVAERLAEYRPEWFEDPVHKDDLKGLDWVCRRSPVPIATGEHTYGLAGLKQLLDNAELQSVLVEIQRIGGVTGWIQAEALVRAYGVRLTTHTNPHIGARLLAGCTFDDGLVEFTTWMDGVFGPSRFEDGRIVPISSAGAAADPLVRESVKWTLV
jgi:L-alanine-DL-glutamate epimerase-like enolase superfamily enzyme